MFYPQEGQIGKYQRGNQKPSSKMYRQYNDLKKKMVNTTTQKTKEM